MNKATRILVVDDEPAVLQVFSMILRSAGYEVWEASNGMQCLQMTREKRPDLVLLDVMLPDLNGFDLCRQIKADPALLDVFVVLVSGKAISAADKVDGAETAADDYIIKPVNPEEFLARIRTILRLRDTTAALRASEQHYRRLVEILPDAIGMIDLRGRLTTVNRQAVEMLGSADPGELLGKSAFDLTLPEDHERVKADIATTLETGVMRNAEYRLLRKDGSRFPVELSAAVSTDADGQSRGIVIVARDITARRQAEARIRELLYILDEARDAIIIRDLEGHIQYFNTGAERIFGWTADEVRGRRTTDLFFADASTFTEAQKELVQTGEWNGELQAVTKARKPIIVHTRWTLARVPHSQSAHVVSISTDITEQKRTAEALKEREELSQKIIGAAMDGFWMLDLEGNLVDVNEAYCRMSGYSRQELLSMHSSDVEINEPSPELVGQHIQRVIQSGSDRFETRHRRKDGRIIEVEVVATFLQLQERYVFAFMRDITERKQAEQFLQASQERFRQLAENIREVFWITNPAKNEMIYISPAYEAIWGRTCASLYAAPMSWVEAIHADDRKRILDAIVTKQISGQYDEVYRIVRSDGSHRWIHDRAFPVRDGSGEVYRVVGIAEDITQRKEMEEALQNAEARYRGIFENATEGIFRTTPEGRILIANPALARMFGYQSPQEMVSCVTDVGRQIYVSPEKRAEMKRLLQEQGAIQGFEEENYRKDGSIIWVSLNAHVVYAASGAVQYFEGTIQDITERKRAETQLAMLAHAVGSTAEMICITDTEDRFTFVNRAFLQGYGYTEAEILGKRPAILISPNNPPALTSKILEQSRLDGWRGEMLDRRKDGMEFPIFLSTSKILDPAGRVIGLMGVAQDITERKWAERLLQTQRDFGTFLSSSISLNAAAAQLLELALQNEGIDCGAVFLLNPDTGALDLMAHRGFSANFAERASHFAGDSVPAGSAGAGRAISRQPDGPLPGVVKELKRESLLAMEVLPVQHTGQVVAVLSVGSHVGREVPAKSCQAVEAIAAQAAGAIARIRAEQSLRASRRLLERTLHSLRAAVFMVNADTMVIEECNPATTQTFGYTRDELIGRPTAALHANEAMAKQFASHLHSAVEDKGFLNNFEFNMRRKDGTVFPTEYSMMPIRDEVGRLVGWVSVVQDITERKRVDEELRQLPWRIIEAQETERLRVARELHDGVNQVIASVKMRLHQMESRIGSRNPAAREILTRCDKLLVQALQENRRIAHNLRPSDLDELGLAVTCRNFCKELQARTNLTVNCSIAPLGQRLPAAVELNLFRIVQEALTNVEKHAHAKTVRLRLSFQENSVVLRIQDDGRGFAPQRSKARRGKGHGIGLTNMHERALSLGGVCEVLSTPKRGTNISVRIPYRPTK